MKSPVLSRTDIPDGITFKRPLRCMRVLYIEQLDHVV